MSTVHGANEFYTRKISEIHDGYIHFVFQTFVAVRGLLPSILEDEKIGNDDDDTLSYHAVRI